jgi:PAS domain S-box-containing protein
MTDQSRLYPDRATSDQPADPADTPRSDTIPRAILDKMPAGVAWHRLVLDEAGRPQDFVFLEVNRAFEDLTGLARGEILGRSLSQVLPGNTEANRAWVQSYGRVAQTGQEVSFEQYSAVLDRWFLITAYCPQEGQFVTFFQDITEAKQMAEDLADLTARHQTALESCPTPVVICDLEGVVRYLNPALERVLGWTVADLLDGPVSRFLDRSPGTGPGGQARVKTGDGREMTVALVVSPLKDSAGGPAGHIVFLDRPES